MIFLRAVCFALALLASASANSSSPQESAALPFERYQALEAAFDPAAADLYADDAVITNKRTYPNGEVRQGTFPAVQYKNLIRSAMPLAAARGDKSSYSNVTYQVEGKNVRISATRFSQMKKYSSPIELVVGPGPDGAWLVLEEHSHSQP